jgi:hypothetical protein
MLCQQTLLFGRQWSPSIQLGSFNSSDSVLNWHVCCVLYPCLVVWLIANQNCHSELTSKICAACAGWHCLLRCWALYGRWHSDVLCTVECGKSLLCGFACQDALLACSLANLWCWAAACAAAPCPRCAPSPTKVLQGKHLPRRPLCWSEDGSQATCLRFATTGECCGLFGCLEYFLLTTSARLM